VIDRLMMDFSSGGMREVNLAGGTGEHDGRGGFALPSTVRSAAVKHLLKDTDGKSN
jgi:hypothetical protein